MISARFLTKRPNQVLISSLLLYEAFTGGGPATAHAQTVPLNCVVGPASVEGLAGAPNWFSPDPASPTNKTGSRLDIDEPRWASSPLLPFEGAYTAGSPTFRALREGDFLYLSFHAPTSSSGSDRVYFGFSEGVGSPSNPLSRKAYLIEIQPAAASSGFDPIPTQVLQIQKYTPTVGWAPDATPAWIEHVRTWRSPDTGLAFGVNFRIALKPTEFDPATNKVWIPKTKNYRAFFGMGIQVASDFTIEASMPSVSPLVTSFVNSAIHVPADYREWALFDGINNGCREGITLDTYDINTSAPNGCSLFTGDPVAQNTFTVEPASIRGNDPQFGDHIVRVQLSLAEWGGLFADSQANWRVIEGTENGSKSSGTWTWNWSSSGGPPTNGLGSAEIGFTCDLLGNAYCPTLNLSDPGSVVPPEVVNQAVLATLSVNAAAPGANLLRIQRGAAYRNMIPVGLSEDKRKATISLRGLPKPKDPKQTSRNVFVKVVKRNMPPHGDAMIAPPLAEMRRIQRFLRTPGPSPFQLQPYVPTPAGHVPPDDGVIAGQKAGVSPPKPYGKPQKPGEAPPPQKPKDPPKPKDEPSRGVTLPETLPLEYSSATQHEIVSRALPVYEVHAYYETGETIPDKRGKPRKALKALAPFGYVLHHDTPFYGFTAGIKGVGCSLAEVQEGLYKVSVPVDGSVQIETTIRAEEKPLHANCCNQKPPIVHVHVNPRGCYCAAPGSGGDGSKLLPLAVLPVALLIWRRKRRSRA
jgi:hypothetical protein